MEVAILGCGPSGLLAAHAVAQARYTPVIFSNRVRSQIGGAQYLHREITGITDQPGKVIFYKEGTALGYATKVYNNPTATTSWDSFAVGEHTIWNLRSAYDNLWELYEGAIVECELNPAVILRLFSEFPLILSTIPATALCVAGHRFKSQSVYIEYGPTPSPTNVIVYNGMMSTLWYRRSVIFNWGGTESTQPLSSRAVKVTKPLETNCNCFPGIKRLGRYGRWEKKQLTHNAYELAERMFL